MATKSEDKKLGFFQRMVKSVYGPEFYDTVEKESFGRSLWYLIRVLALTSLVVGIVVAVVPFYTNVDGWVDKLKEGIDFFPEDLVITMEDSKLSVNQPEPYFFSIPVEWEESSTPDTGYNDAYSDVLHFIVIDTTTPYSTKQFHEFNTIAWATETEIHILDDSGAVSSIDWTVESEEPINFVLDHDAFEGFLDEGLGFIKPLVPFFMLFIWIFVLLGLVIGYLGKLLFSSLFVWLIGANVFKRKDYDYPKAYITGMHATTLPILLGGVLFMIRQWVQVPQFAFQYTILLLIMVSVNYSQLGKGKKK